MFHNQSMKSIKQQNGVISTNFMIIALTRQRNSAFLWPFEIYIMFKNCTYYCSFKSSTLYSILLAIFSSPTHISYFLNIIDAFLLDLKSDALWLSPCVEEQSFQFARKKCTNVKYISIIWPNCNFAWVIYSSTYVYMTFVFRITDSPTFGCPADDLPSFIYSETYIYYQINLTSDQTKHKMAKYFNSKAYEHS